MTLLDFAADARIGVLAAYAEDMHDAYPGALAPPPDPRLSPEWTIRGYLVAQDVLWHPFSWLEVVAGRTCYGYLAESTVTPGEFVAAIRGTADTAEWLVDSRFVQTAHPSGGKVELGFWSVYQTMRYSPLAGTDSPVAQGISHAIGRGTVIVVGHSLGGALASYLALDLAKNQNARVRARVFASPRPGDQGFADAFAANVKDAVSYVGQHDLVPESPAGFGYLPLHCVQILSADIVQAIIHANPLCWHHLWSYLAQMHWSLMDWSTVPACDKNLTACILGPATH